MSENTPEAPASEAQAAPEAPAAAAPEQPAATPAKRSLEDLLSSLDDDARGVVLGEVSKARSEARNLRDRLKEAEPKLTEWQALQEASKSELEKAQEAAKSAVDRIASMQQSVAAAKIEAALTGVIPDVAAVIEDLNIAKFLDAEGNVDASKVDALRTKFATFATPANPGMKPNPAQGRSASPAPSTHDLIAQAQAAGDMKTAIRLKSQLALEASEK